jgi:hypothetical protein
MVKNLPIEPRQVIFRIARHRQVTRRRLGVTPHSDQTLCYI